MTEKQVAFRLDEELHRRLQMYAMQKNESVKEVMEEVVKQLLRGGQGIRPRMLKVIHQKFREDEEGIKEVLRKACADSIRLNSADKGTVIQVIISEFCDFRILETPKGIVPVSVIDSKAYLLYEFECITDIPTFYAGEMPAYEEMITSLAGQYKDFMKWLMKHGIVEEFEYENDKEEDGYENDVELIFQKYYFMDNKEDPTEYLNFIYRWNPAKYHEVINLIRENNLSSYVEEQVEKAWKEITCREELELNFE